MSKVRVHLADPGFRAGECPLKFTLTYEGELRTGSSRGSDGKSPADRKQGLREYYHLQLQRLWRVNHFLSGWAKKTDGFSHERMEEFARKNAPSLGETEFIPLVSKAAHVDCWIDFRILRPSHDLVNAPDIDNQVKVLFDGLKMPRTLDEMGKQAVASPSPLYVLLEDDGLVNKITSTQDELLQPILGKSDISNNDVRVVIDVHIRPQVPTSENVIFYSDENDKWDHGYYDGLPENLSNLNNMQLKAVATQCVFRIRALAEAFGQWNSGRLMRPITSQGGDEADRQREWQEENNKLKADSDSQRGIWQHNLWPKARSIKGELNRRIFGEPPYPKDGHSTAIDHGMLAGPHPLAEAAAELETLIRRLA